MRIVIGVLAVSLALGCGDDSDRPTGLLGDLLGKSFGLPHSALPPMYTGCGRVQAGYDPGDPGADPPTYPTLDGQPYLDLQDPFCSIAFTRRFSEGDDGTVFLDEDIYTVEMGEPDPAREDDVQPWMAEGVHYCSFRWTVEANAEASQADGYSQDDVVYLTETFVEASAPCNQADSYDGSDPYTIWEYAYRSTRSDVVLFLPAPQFVAWQGDDIRFDGYAGIPDSGGAMMWEEAAGWATYYEQCEPEPAAVGPGFCTPECRIFSASNDLPLCTWDDVAALPSNPDLVHPDWRNDYPDQYAEVYGEN